MRLKLNSLLTCLDWANKWLTPIFSGIAAVLGVMWQNDFVSLKDKYPNWPGLFNYIAAYVPPLFITFFIAAGICSSFRFFTQKSINRLKRELKAECSKVEVIANNIETLVDGLLLKLSEKIGFAKGEPSRITIYIHRNNKFISFGRYTPDPSFGGKGRNTLPDNEGCIGQAWRSDWCFESNLGYKESRKKYNITRETHVKLRMKAVFFAVKRIDAPNKQPLAVLVVESKNANQFPEATIKDILDNEEMYLAEIIHCLKDHIPDPQDALKRGF
jgi:hypothetical protein